MEVTRASKESFWISSMMRFLRCSEGVIPARATRVWNASPSAVDNRVLTTMGRTTTWPQSSLDVASVKKKRGSSIGYDTDLPILMPEPLEHLGRHPHHVADV
jgi:hypothetical protein